MPTLSISASGAVTIGGVRIDGIASAPVIKHAVLMDEQNTSNTSGRTKTFSGFNDADISFSIVMHTDSKYQAMADLTAAFRKMENGNPIIYDLDFPLAKACQVQTAIIKDMTSTEGDADGPIRAAITLTETDPSINLVQQQQNAKISPSAEQTDASIENDMIDDEDAAMLRRAAQAQGYTVTP